MSAGSARQISRPLSLRPDLRSLRDVRRFVTDVTREAGFPNERDVAILAVTPGAGNGSEPLESGGAGAPELGGPEGGGAEPPEAGHPQ